MLDRLWNAVKLAILLLAMAAVVCFVFVMVRKNLSGSTSLIAEVKYEAPLSVKQESENRKIATENREQAKAVQEIESASAPKPNLIAQPRSVLEIASSVPPPKNVTSAVLDYQQLAKTKQDQPATVVITERLTVPIQFGEAEIPKGTTVKVAECKTNGTLVVEFLEQKHCILASATDFANRVAEIRSRRIVSDGMERKTTMISVTPVTSKDEATATPSVAASTKGLVLPNGWSFVRKEHNPVELAIILDGVCEPRVNLSPNPSIIVYQDIPYLERIPNVLTRIGKRMTSKVSIIYPAFPKTSFFFYPLDGNFTAPGYSGNFNRLMLIADYADQFAGVQLLDEAPKVGTRKRNCDPKYDMFDFLQQGVRKGKTWRVCHDVKSNDAEGLVSVYSELFSDLGDCRERSLLILPKPVADLIVYHVKSNAMFSVTTRLQR